MGEHDCPKNGRGHYLHSIHVAMSKQDIVIELSVDNFDVDENSFPLSSIGTFWKSPSGDDGRPS
jgi:hypothetical protein